jgi:hypothetical protein
VAGTSKSLSKLTEFTVEADAATVHGTATVPGDTPQVDLGGIYGRLLPTTRWAIRVPKHLPPN